MKLFDIERELEDVFFELEENGGELTPELEERLAINEQNLKEKLDGYRKIYTKYKLDAEACKKEEARISCIRKVKENNAEKLRNIMYEAVVKFGNEGKSGNKTIDLVDSKLYTKKSKSCVIDEKYSDILKTIFFEYIFGLYDNGMLEDKSLDIKRVVYRINEAFVNSYPEEAKELYEARGHYFTEEDLLIFNVNIQFNVSLADLIQLDKYSIIDAYFSNTEKAVIVEDNKSSRIKPLLDNNISFAKEEYSECLIIK